MTFYYKYEDNFLLSSITKKNATILDVGCGLGRYLIPLSSQGHRVIGVEKNRELIDNLNEKGYTIYEASEISNINLSFDYIIMSHIIEHIEPHTLVSFIDSFLDLLKTDGELIIATPLLYDEFYNDFDHIKPYYPKSIQMLYSEYQQMQLKPKHRLKMKNIWIRKWPYVIHPLQNNNICYKIIIKLVNKALLLLYIISRKYISRKTGWVGIFQMC